MYYPQFAYFVRKVTTETFNVKDEISNFKRDNPNERPVILFDITSSISMIMSNNYHERRLEFLCAGRFQKASSRATQMFEDFKKLGVKMLFFNKIIPDKFPDWCVRKSKDYNQQKELFERQAVMNITNSEDFHKFGINLLKSYHDNYLSIAKNYGEVFLSLENECDADILQYALKKKAFAIFTSGVDFILMPKLKLLVWSTKLDTETFLGKRVNKDKLKQYLQLNDFQLPVLILFCKKNSYFDIFDIKNNSHIKKIISTGQEEFLALADFIKNNFPSGIPLPDNEFKKLCEILYDSGRLDRCMEWIEEKVNKILKFYNNENLKPNNPLLNKENLWLHTHIKHTNSTLVSTILKGSPITICHRFIDLSIPNTRPFADLIIPLIRCQMGVVLYDKELSLNSNPNQFEIFYKPNDTEDYQSKLFEPIYPCTNIPSIQDILDIENENKVKLTFKFSLLSWIITMKFEEIDYLIFMKYHRTPFLVPLITLYYLVKKNHFTVEEADIIFLSIYQSVNGYPKNGINLIRSIDRRAFWISFTYTQVIYFFRNSFIICGLNDYTGLDFFDGFLFHKLYAIRDSIEFSEIESYRIYAK